MVSLFRIHFFSTIPLLFLFVFTRSNSFFSGSSVPLPHCVRRRIHLIYFLIFQQMSSLFCLTFVVEYQDNVCWYCCCDCRPVYSVFLPREGRRWRCVWLNTFCNLFFFHLSAHLNVIGVFFKRIFPLALRYRKLKLWKEKKTETRIDSGDMYDRRTDMTCTRSKHGSWFRVWIAVSWTPEYTVANGEGIFERR